MIDGAVVGLLKEAGPWVSIAMMLAFGWLIPRWTHNERIKDYKERNQYLETALEHERKINDFQNEQLGKLLVLAETGNSVLTSIQKQSSKEAA